MIPDHLRLQPGQERLSPEQEAEARHFAEARITAQLSTEPVNEAETEALLKQAYEAASLPSPARIQWVDGPLSLVAALAPSVVGEHMGESAEDSTWGSMWDLVESRVWKKFLISLNTTVRPSLWQQVRARVWAPVGTIVWDSVWEGIYASVRANEEAARKDTGEARVWEGLYASGCAYEAAPRLAFCHFFHHCLTPNELHPLAHFTERVSGCWLGLERAILVRRPRLLTRDTQGQLHNATGQCLEYRDGWGISAWHGVRVSERVIWSPETLTRQDFLGERDVEVRRVMQERMGERFIRELGGVVLDSSPRGTLYEVSLPADDPEGVARYVQVQDASTERRYFLRVPPTIQTAAEAVAWTFQVAADDYRPAQET